MKSLLLSILFFVFCLSDALAQTIFYVDINASGANNGSSWANAFPDVNTAILSASPNDEIWIAKGVYLTTSDNDPAKCFVITKNIRIYGGFNGTETAFSQRNVQANVTTLSGDIGVAGDSTDNSNNIFQILNQPNTVVIDGFTISQVYSLTIVGGAVSVNNCNDVRINHCYFNGNFSSLGGGAAIEAVRLSKIQVNSCTFTNNNGGGAILAKDTSEISIDSSYFGNNFSPADGGSITSTLSKLTVTNTSFDYTAPITGVGQSIIYAWANTYYDTTYYFNNCSFSGITSSGGGLLTFNNVKKVVIKNSRFNNNKLLNSIPNILNFYGEEIELRKCSFQNNQANGSDLLSLQGAIIKEVLLDSTNFTNNTGASTLLDVYGKKAILQNSTFLNNQAANYHVYLNVDTLLLNNSVFRNNTGASQATLGCPVKYLTITNNTFENNHSSATINASPVISLTCSDNTFSNNKASYGGVLNFYSATGLNSTINNCVFTGNNADNEGGALVLYGSGNFSILNSLFQNNNAAQGGAISSYMNTDIKYCRFVNNTVPYGASTSGNGGAIYSGSSFKLNLYKISFENNTATEGGAVYAEDSLFTNRCYFVGNKTTGSGQYGAAINTEKYSKLVNTKMYKNTCDSNGVIFNKGRLDMYNCTVSGNGKKGAVLNKYVSNALQNNFINDIFWNNGDSINIIDLSSTVRTINNCITNEPWLGSNLSVDPKLDLELKISTISPAIDAGINYPGMPLVDYDSTARIKLVAIDIGAYEISEDGRTANVVTGYTYVDADGDCVLDTSKGDVLLPGIPITVKPQNTYASSDAKGKYLVKLPPGAYTVTAPTNPALSNNYVLTCPAAKTYAANFSGYADTLHNINFGYKKVVVQNCKYDLSLSISYGVHSPCMRNQINISAFNNSTAVVSNAIIQAVFPSNIFIKQSPYPYTRTVDTVIFTIGAMNGLSQLSFTVIDSLECDPSLISSGFGCFKFTIKENADCVPPAWDKSDLGIVLVLSACNPLPMSTSVTIRNNGQGDMSDSTEYRIFEDYVLIRTGKIKLKSLQMVTITFPYNPSKQNVPKVVELDQTIYHPTEKYIQVTVFPCYPSLITPYYEYTPPLTFNPYSITTVPNTSNRISEQCISFLGSHDPNNIEVSPDGIPAASYVEPDQQMSYKINFQNTGTDTAFAVVLVDTLDANLDLNTLRMGVSSHPYTWTLSGTNKPVLTIRFNNILLPDSNKTVSGSKGYVTYTINQLAALPDYTEIDASAGIYFDFNEPVLTNHAFVNILRAYTTDFAAGAGITLTYRNVETSILNTEDGKSVTISLYPNPLLNEGNILIDPPVEGKKKLNLYNINGQLIQENTFEGSNFTFVTKDFVEGVYYYKLYLEENIIKVGKCLIGR